MAASSGRTGVRISLGDASSAVVIAGARVDTFTVGNEPIDITSKDSAGVRTLLADFGVRTIDLSVEGVMVGDTLLTAATGDAAAVLDEYVIDFASGAKLVANFFITSFEVGGNHDGETTFSASFQSSGPFTFTAAA